MACDSQKQRTVKSNGVLKLETTEDSLLLRLSKLRVSIFSFFYSKTSLKRTPQRGPLILGNLHMPDISKAVLELENKKESLLSIRFCFFHHKMSRSRPLLLVLAVTVSSASTVLSCHGLVRFYGFGCHGRVRFYCFWL